MTFHRFSQFRNLVLSALSLLVVFVFLCPHADARWFWQKKPKKGLTPAEQVQTFQPPPDNAIKLYCEPYRVKAVKLNQKPRLLKIFYAPRISWLVHKNRECKNKIMDQEYTYLKHVDIEQSPRLPKLKTDPVPSSGAPDHAQ